jgi:hypothetical protein
MNEIPSPEASVDPPINKKNEWIILILISGLIPLFIWGTRKGSIWPDKISILFGLFPPMIFILLRSWNRLFRPNRLPARWTAGSRMQARMSTLEGVVLVPWFLSFGCMIFEDISKHHSHHSAHGVWYYLFLTSQYWWGFLQMYIKDRIYIPPPREPTKGGWTGTIKGLHSDHWGGRQIPKPDNTEA